MLEVEVEVLKDFEQKRQESTGTLEFKSLNKDLKHWLKLYK